MTSPSTRVPQARPSTGIRSSCPWKRSAKRISGAHVKSLLGYKLGAGAAAAPLRAALRLLPDRVELPYPSEDLFWTLFRRRAA